VSGNTIGAFEFDEGRMDGRARIGRFSSPKAIDEDAMKRAARDDGRAVVGGDATRDAREGTRDARVFFVCFSFGRSSGGRFEVESRRSRRFGGRARSHRDRARETR